MTDQQSKAKQWLKNLTKEVQSRELPEEFFPCDAMSIPEVIYSLETTGMEMINMMEESADPLEGLPEEYPNPSKMADEDLGEALLSAWAILSPSD